MNNAESILALAMGDHVELAEQAIASGATPDQFLADLLTREAQTPVLVDEGYTLTAGEILFRSHTAAATPGGGNHGNGTLAVDAVGQDVLDGTYTLVCTSTRTDRGIFELRAPDGSVIEPLNVGTPYVSKALSLTISDGTTDFAIGDTFSIAVTASGSFHPYNFTSLSANTLQVASAVLARDIDTSDGELEQFANATGPAILPAGFARLAAKPDDVDADVYAALVEETTEQLEHHGIVSRDAPIATQIRVLAQGDFEQRVADAIDAGISGDQFLVDLATFEARDVVTISINQTVTAGEILCREFASTVTAGGSNSGNGAMTVSLLGLMVVEGDYTATCVATHTNGGRFEIRRPDGSAIGFATVGVPFVSDDLELTVADGSADFHVGDVFTITVFGGECHAYDYASGLRQYAAAVVAFDTATTDSTKQQLATVRGPAILDGPGVHLGFPHNLIDPNAYNRLVMTCVVQLAQRGIVLRGEPHLMTTQSR
jgi:hypothetical protein